MGDDRWDALLESPYDGGSNELPRPGWRWLAVIGGSAVLGVAIGWVAASLGGGGVEVVGVGSSTTIASDTTTTLALSVGDEGFLTGYTAIDDTAFRVMGSFQSGEMTYVVVSEIVRVDLDRTMVPREPVGSWELVTAGGSVAMSRDTRAALSPGLSLLAFETTDPFEQLRFRRASLQETTASCTACEDMFTDTTDGDISLGDTQLPFAMSQPSLAFELDGDLTLVIESIELDENWGTVEWHVEGTEEALVAVEFFVTYVGSTDLSEEGDTRLAPAHLLGPRFGQSQVPVGPQPASHGIAELARFGPQIAPDTDSVQPILRWQARWVAPTGDPVSLDHVG